MSGQIFLRCARFVPAIVGTLLAVLAPAYAQTGGPSFSTNTPMAGLANGTFYVFVQIVNDGATTASNVEATSATLGGVAATSPSFPTVHGSLVPTQSTALELHFDGSRFASGQRYLLTVRGTYQNGASSSGFAVNRFVTVQSFTGADLTILRHIEALDAVDAKFASLPGLSASQDNQSLLAFIQTRPEFSASGINDTTVWAQFADDGDQLLVVNGDRPGAPVTGSAVPLTSSTPAAVSSTATFMRAARVAEHAATPGPGLQSVPSSGGGPPTGLPKSSTVRLLTALGPEWTEMFGNLATVLGNFNYATSSLRASVANLRGVGGEGVLLFSSHGGAGAFAPVYAVMTDDKIPSVAIEMSSDRTATPKALVWMAFKAGTQTNSQGVTVPLIENNYGITDRFVTKYWKANGGFDPSSLVFIDACDSSTQLAGNFQTAVFAAGAGVYAGWTGPVHNKVALYTAAFTFDRLLGADVFCPEDGAESCTDGPAAGGDASPAVYAQRPFDYASLIVDLPLHNTLAGDPATEPQTCPNDQNPCPLSWAGHALQFTPNAGGSTFGLLAPSIQNMFVEETQVSGTHSTLFITGNFGNTPGAVTVNGQTLSACQWTSLLINCTIPDSGTASGGPVQVTVDDHMSNEAALTAWQAPWNFTAAGPGSMFQASTFNLRFRADTRLYRPRIHNPPIEPQSMNLSLLTTSSGSASCSGTATSGGAVFSWAGNPAIPLFMRGSKGAYFTGVVRLVDSRHMTMSLTGASTFCSGTEVVSGLTLHGPVGIAFPTGFFIQDPPMTLDINANILAGKPKASGGWAFPPGMANAQLQWSQVTPAQGSGPDPKSPR